MYFGYVLIMAYSERIHGYLDRCKTNKVAPSPTDHDDEELTVLFGTIKEQETGNTTTGTQQTPSPAAATGREDTIAV